MYLSMLKPRIVRDCVEYPPNAPAPMSRYTTPSGDRLTNLSLNELIGRDLTLGIKAQQLIDSWKNLKFKNLFAQAIGLGAVMTSTDNKGDRHMIICIVPENMESMQAEWDNMIVAAYYVCGHESITLICDGETLQQEHTRKEITNFYLWHRLGMSSDGDTKPMPATTMPRQQEELATAQQSNAMSDTQQVADLVTLSVVIAETGETDEQLQSRLQSSGFKMFRADGRTFLDADTAANLVEQFFMQEAQERANKVRAIAAGASGGTQAMNGSAQSYAEMELIPPAKSKRGGKKSAQAQSADPEPQAAEPPAAKGSKLTARKGFRPASNLVSKNAGSELRKALPTAPEERMTYLNAIVAGDAAADTFLNRVAANANNKALAFKHLRSAAQEMLNALQAKANSPAKAKNRKPSGGRKAKATNNEPAAEPAAVTG